MTVLVKIGPNKSKYHKQGDDGRPPCRAHRNTTADDWTDWGFEKADTWYDPCQHPQCYGEPEYAPEDRVDRAWPA